LLLSKCRWGWLRSKQGHISYDKRFLIKGKDLKTINALAVLLALSAVVARAGTYSWTNLQSDIPGVAQHTDPNLVNPWGVAVPSPNGPIWVSDNGTGVSTLYRLDGTAFPNPTNPLVVTIPTAARNKDGGNPTGMVFNGTSFFKVSNGTNSLPARFIFVSEDGSISGWNPRIDPTNAIIAVDNGTNNGTNHAVYKGAALGFANGHNFLFVTNFHSGEVETYDENFHQVNPNGFADPNIPAGFAPFGIQNLNGSIYVTYALQNKERHDDVAGPGNGFVDKFDTSGNLIGRLISNGNLNSPWGLAIVDGKLWVGNFGDGKINNYDPNTGAFIETLMKADGTPLQFNGLWSLLPLAPGVFFTAGIGDESHGLFGLITGD
jgi:uncharacterized protein (TIGR03118 family)